MPMKNTHEFFKTIAKQYVDIDGEKLKDELMGFDKEKKINISPEFNSGVYNKINKLKIKKHMIPAGTLAACLLLFTLSYYFIQNHKVVSPHSNFEQVSSEPKYELITLNVNLPQNYYVSQIKQDKEETIYYINNSANDDVILTVKKSDEDIEREGLKEISIKNSVAYGLAKADYSILKFEKEGNIYTLTCKYNYNTLIEISKSIL